jgi:asparagine synthase (glutamine-hydrolysing)
MLPDWIMNRPKTGFTPPSKEWVPALVAAHRNSLDDGYLVSHGIISPEGCKKMTRTQSRHSPWTDLFYRTLVLEFWARGVEAASGAKHHHAFRVPAPV